MRRAAPRDTRAALFGDYTRGGSPLPMYNSPRDTSSYAGGRTAEDLETHNESQLEGLTGQVKLLKQISVKIGEEVRESTKMLSGMNDTFGETSGFLSGTMKRMNRMAKRQGSQWCLWIAFLLICMTVFFWTWLLRR